MKYKLLLQQIHKVLINAKDPILESNIAREASLDVNFSKRYPFSILVAEDNPVNQKLIHIVLEKLGYEVHFASNGQEAIESLKEKAHDLIFMDVQMPQLDGLDATQIIRRIFKQQPVIIALTANAIQDDKEQCFEAGMDDYISKPIRMDELIEKLKKWSAKVGSV